MKKLKEGMRPGDLEDLVLPMITIDEFESKVDENAIVIGFYVNEKDGANDLNRFIQKSPLQILDTDISPAPDQHGFFLVFVEFINDSRLAENISSILEEVTMLSGNENWQMSVRGMSGIIPFSSKKLKKHFDTKRDEKNMKQVVEFFKNSDLQNIIMENDTIVLEGMNGKLIGKMLSCGAAVDIFNSYNLFESALKLDLTTTAEYMRMSRLIGEGWIASRFGDFTILKQSTSDDVLLLSECRFA